MHMKQLTGLVVLGILLLAATSSAGEPFKAKPLDLSASDIADLLGVRWWKHRLEFNPPVTEVAATLCELRRKADGGWEKVRLSRESGIEMSEKFTETTIVILIHEGRNGPELMLRVGGSRGTEKLAKMPDFTKMWLSKEGSRVLQACIVLAQEFKNPNRATDREEDLVRVIGLEIKAK